MLYNPANESLPDDVEHYCKEEEDGQKDEDLVGNVSSVELRDQALADFDFGSYLFHTFLGIIDLT